MNWISTIFSAVMGWLLGRRKTKADTLEEVNDIYRKGTEARQRSEIDTRYRRD